MMGACVTLALYQVLTKDLLNRLDFWTVFAGVRAAIFLILIPVIFYQRRFLKQALEGKTTKAFAFVAGSEGFNLAGIFFATLAAAAGPITLVTAVGAVQPMFVLVLATILSVFLPDVGQEVLGVRVFVMKLVAILMSCVGVVLTS